jgi:hypothetical protein
MGWTCGCVYNLYVCIQSESLDGNNENDACGGLQLMELSTKLIR